MTTQLDPDEIRYRTLLVETAAAWWADLLRARRAPSLLRDAGHTSLGAALMDSQREAPSTSEDAIDRFERALREKLVQRASWGGSDEGGRWYGVDLSVDYGPEGILADAADETGVSGFPFKTRMSIDGAGIRVRQGYGAPEEAICTTKKDVLYDVIETLMDAEFSAIPTVAGQRDRAAVKACLDRGRRLRGKCREFPPFFEGNIDDIVAAIVAADSTAPTPEEARS